MKAFIFDFDGVIVDSELLTFKLLQKICKENGLELKDECLELRIGKKIAPFIDEIFAHDVDEGVRNKIVEQFYDRFLPHAEEYVVPIKHTVDFIREYEGAMKLTIASVGHRESIERLLKKIGIFNKFEIILSSEDVVNLKPDPEIYLKMAKALHLNPKDCYVFEDSLVGVKSGVSAGCSVYVVRNGLNSKTDFSSCAVRGFIDSVNDFPDTSK